MIIDKFSAVDRSYETAKLNFKNEIPKDFNFAFDVIDAWAKWKIKQLLFLFQLIANQLRKLAIQLYLICPASLQMRSIRLV